MRETPTWRIPFGIIGLFVALMIYGILIAVYLSATISTWPGWLQTVIYVFLGVVWLLPLGRFLIWMETGRWSAPQKDKDPTDAPPPR